MKLREALDEKLMDVRLVDRLLAEGKITKEQFEKHQEALEDEEGHFEYLDRDKK